MEKRKLIIIGSGNAGSTAGIYAARANLEPLVFEGHEPGGQLSLTTMVENFPGFPEGVMGPELMDNMKNQAKRFGAEYRMETVTGIGFDGDNPRPRFRLTTDEGEYLTDSIIIASGASARMLGLESERRLLGHGVSTCATCDGFFFRGQEVVVVGGGDTAMEDSLFLAKHATRVTVAHRRDELRASPIMAQRALNHPRIEFRWDTVVTDVSDPEKGEVDSVLFKNLKTGEEERFPTNGLFVAIGHDPNTEVFKGILQMTPTGYLLIENGQRTQIEGIFAAGDVHDAAYRQAITAAAAGCRAAMDCERYLESVEHTPGEAVEEEPA